MRLLILFYFACSSSEKNNEPSDDGNVLVDADGDGFTADEDCRDDDELINPNAQEICDAIDNNCDGQIDENVQSTFYADSDEDGFGNPNIEIQSCDVPTGYVQAGTDCDDTHAQVYPGAEEICDGLDNNCNEDTDEGLLEDFYEDMDGDGFGNDNVIIQACEPGFGRVQIGGDCDDENAYINPFVEELCDEVDNNCDGQIDENVLSLYYQDFDEDSFGNPDVFIESCSPVDGYVENNEDCDDIESFVHPYMVEVCDDIDNDCDGVIDEDDAIDVIAYYPDVDEDGFGASILPQYGCAVPAQSSLVSGDCDDENDLANPAMVELCDGFDNNCDGVVDEDTAINVTMWYEDFDNDGYGSPNTHTSSCSQPTGYIDNADDCDDTTNTVSPETIWYVDSDNDGYGSSQIFIQQCTQPNHFVMDSSDCNDTSAATHVGAPEICDEIDNDCDGDIDQNDTDFDTTSLLTFYLDFDGDGYGDNSQSVMSCTAPTNGTLLGDDCDDDDETVNLDAEEVCDEIDNDCDGDIDQNDSDFDTSSLLTYYLDNDGDGYGDEDQSETGCFLPEGYSFGFGDCDDTDSTSTTSDIDADCDGVETSLDCDDTDSSIYLGSDSTCPAASCSELLQQGETEDGLYWIDLNSGATEVYCDMSRDEGGWLQCAGWQSRKDQDNYFEAYYPRDIITSTYNLRATHDGLNDEYWSIDCAQTFHDIGATRVMLYSTTGDWWSFGLPSSVSNLDSFYQKDIINVGTLSDDVPIDISTNTNFTNIAVDWDGNCSYGTGSHQWKILAEPNASCITQSVSGIAYRHHSNVYTNCTGGGGACANYKDHVACGDGLIGSACEDHWTYVMIR